METRRKNFNKILRIAAVALLALFFVFASAGLSGLIFPFSKSATTAYAIEMNHYGFAGGDGGTNSPFLIATAEQLDNVRNYSYRFDDKYDILLDGNCFKVIADIDLTEYLSEDGAGYNGGKGWKPIMIGASTFDGGGKNGYKISGLWLNRPDEKEKYVGLFSYATDSVIKNIVLELSDKGITGFSHVGGIAGMLTTYNLNKTSSVISGCSVTGKITSVKTYETLQDSDTSAHAGLIAGKVQYATIEKCYAQGSVNGLTGIGGIAGDANFADISDCYFKGVLKSTAPAEWETVCSGGIAGRYYGDSVMRNCFYLGQSGGDIRVAAIVGFSGSLGTSGNATPSIAPPAIYSCYYNEDEFTGSLHFITIDEDAIKELIIENSKGLTSAEMKKKSSYVGWDFETVWGFDKDKNLVLRPFGNPYDPPSLTWLWITLGCTLFGATAVAAGTILYRRKKTVTVTNDVIKMVEVVREVPALKKPLPADLSKRERRVAELLLQRKSRREIADELRVIEGTVGTYITRICIKAGVDGIREFIFEYLGGIE